MLKGRQIRQHLGHSARKKAIAERMMRGRLHLGILLIPIKVLRLSPSTSDRKDPYNDARRRDVAVVGRTMERVVSVR